MGAPVDVRDAQSAEHGALLRPHASSGGNPRWLAPELCRRWTAADEDDDDATAGGGGGSGGGSEAARLARLLGGDCWALGVVGWELLTLRDPLDDFREQVPPVPPVPPCSPYF